MNILIIFIILIFVILGFIKFGPTYESFYPTIHNNMNILDIVSDYDILTHHHIVHPENAYSSQYGDIMLSMEPILEKEQKRLKHIQLSRGGNIMKISDNRPESFNCRMIRCPQYVRQDISDKPPVQSKYDNIKYKQITDENRDYITQQGVSKYLQCWVC